MVDTIPEIVEEKIIEVPVKEEQIIEEKIVEEPIKEDQITRSIVVKDFVEDEPEIEAPINKIEEKNFFLIVGSFSIRENAEKLHEQLLKKNYQSNIISSDNGMYRVSIESFANKDEAIIMLNDMRQKSKEKVWLLSKIH